MTSPYDSLTVTYDSLTIDYDGQGVEAEPSEPMSWLSTVGTSQKWVHAGTGFGFGR